MKKLLILFVALFMAACAPEDTVPTQTINDSTEDVQDLPIVASGSLSGRNGYTSNGDVQLLFNSPTNCLLYTSPSPRDATLSRMPSSA